MLSKRTKRGKVSRRSRSCWVYIGAVYHVGLQNGGEMDRALLRNARRQADRPNWIVSDTAKRFSPERISVCEIQSRVWSQTNDSEATEIRRQCGSHQKPVRPRSIALFALRIAKPPPRLHLVRLPKRKEGRMPTIPIEHRPKLRARPGA